MEIGEERWPNLPLKKRIILTKSEGKKENFSKTRYVSPNVGDLVIYCPRTWARMLKLATEVHFINTKAAMMCHISASNSNQCLNHKLTNHWNLWGTKFALVNPINSLKIGLMLGYIYVCVIFPYINQIRNMVCYNCSLDGDMKTRETSDLAQHFHRLHGGYLQNINLLNGGSGWSRG